MGKSIVLVTASGKDAPGITSELTGILAKHNKTITDIAQAVIHGLLSLSILFEVDSSDKEKTVLQELVFRATELGLKLDYRTLADGEGKAATSAKSFHYAITLIAESVSARALHEVTQVLASHKTNIDVIKRLSENEFGCVELVVSSSAQIDREALKKALLAIAKEQGVDIALQAEGLYRRAKRLVVMDMDSTLIQNEVIDELARARGVYDEVSEITHRAMSGLMDYDESLKQRCEKLKGMPLAEFDEVFQSLRITPGAEDLICVLKKLGYKIALISGGFTYVAEKLKDRLGIDFVYANKLEIENGKLTGKVLPPIVNAARKADLLDVIAQQEKIALDQVVAIGDGANDIPMLNKAGLGIAFNAKPSVREKAHTALSQKNMRSILYLLGLSGRELSEGLSP
jgi:phosphoserine phosphatase